MIDITVDDLEKQIDQIMEDYDNGGEEIYRIEYDGKYVMLTPYNGPWEETVQLDEEGHHVVPLPDRIINKYGLKEGDDIEMEVLGDSIILRLGDEDNK
jgi:hypothetical protein